MSPTNPSQVPKSIPVKIAIAASNAAKTAAGCAVVQSCVAIANRLKKQSGILKSNSIDSKRQKISNPKYQITNKSQIPIYNDRKRCRNWSKSLPVQSSDDHISLSASNGEMVGWFFEFRSLRFV